jgi:hypothetical protein
MSGKISGKIILGIGFNSGEYPTRNGSKNAKEYDLWRDMLKRCGDKVKAKHHTYIGTTCSENFKSYTFFYEWCQEQIGFGNNDEVGLRGAWQLDKDLLEKGNKLYSEDTCVFIPQRINKLITKNEAKRGKHLIGTWWKAKRGHFITQCNDLNGERKHIGCFDTQKEAYEAYKTFKEDLIKQVAEQYKSQIDPRAYKALLEYTVEITD